METEELIPVNNPGKNEDLIADILQTHKTTLAAEPEEEEQEEEEIQEQEQEQENNSKTIEIKNLEEPTEKEAFTNLIDTDLIVIVGDVVLSRLFYFVFKRWLKRNVKIEDFSLTPEETKAVSKLLKKYAETKEINISPSNALIFGILSVYASKGIIAFSMDKVKEEKPISVKEETKTISTGKRGRPRKIPIQEVNQ